jgi:deazaflavin-dependent oxidoreductase (nitroreductase family)
MPVRRSDVYEPWEEQLARGWIKLMNATNVMVYQASDGRVGGSIPSGTPLMLLTTRRKSSGRPHTVTIVYLDGEKIGAPDRWFVVGSNGGLSRDPGWVVNIAADPHVGVQIDADHYDTTAAEVDPAEIAPQRVIDALTEGYRPFGDYQRRAGATRRAPGDTGRVIKVIEIAKVTPRA